MTKTVQCHFTCLYRYPEVAIRKDRLRRCHCNPASSGEHSRLSDQNKSLHRWVSSSAAVHTHTHTLSKALFCIWETAWGVLWVCEREWEWAGAECAQREQRIRSLNAQMETVWRQWRGPDNNHRLAKRKKHLGQRTPPHCVFKHRALTWCSSHAPLYWCPCPIHWGVPGNDSRSLKGAASLRIWSCGCRRRKRWETKPKFIS